MHINTINKKKGNILNITEIKVKTNIKEIVKLKSMKEKAEMFWPSLQTYGLSGGRHDFG